MIYNDGISNLEKVNFLRKLNLEEFAKKMVFDDMTKLLIAYSKLDNSEIEGWIEKIIYHAEIKGYFEKLLIYLEINGRNFKKIPSTIWNVILN